jgi:hypothetical protein
VSSRIPVANRQTAEIEISSNIAGLNTTQRISHRDSSAFIATTQTASPPVPHQKIVITSPGSTFSPPLIVTNAAGEQTINVTFTSTGPPIARCSANYTIVRQGEVTRTTDTTSTSMSARDSTVPPTDTKTAAW